MCAVDNSRCMSRSRRRGLIHRRAQGECPRRSSAFSDAGMRAWESVYGQGHPSVVQ